MKGWNAVANEMSRETARQLVTALNEAVVKHEHAHSPQRLNDLTEKIKGLLAELQAGGHPVERVGRDWRLVPTDEERAAAQAVQERWQRTQLVGKLAEKRALLRARLESAHRDLDETLAILERKGTDFWPMRSSNWTEIQTLTTEVALLQRTLTDLGILAEPSK